MKSGTAGNSLVGLSLCGLMLLGCNSAGLSDHTDTVRNSQVARCTAHISWMTATAPQAVISFSNGEVGKVTVENSSSSEAQWNILFMGYDTRPVIAAEMVAKAQFPPGAVFRISSQRKVLRRIGSEANIVTVPLSVPAPLDRRNGIWLVAVARCLPTGVPAYESTTVLRTSP